MRYELTISPKMKDVHNFMLGSLAGVDYCLSERDENLILEVPRSEIDSVVETLKIRYRDVVPIRRAYEMIEDLHDFILVKPMISEAPLQNISGVPCPSLEKSLVDMASDREFRNLTEVYICQAFQQAFELYDINTSRILRYAARKGEKEEVSARIESVNQGRVRIVKTIQNYFSGQPVDKVWLFGSFSRMEERADSDIDILFSPQPEARLGLFKYSQMALELEKLLSRKVDLVTEKSLKDFAVQSVNNDKILIYERA